VIDIKKLKSNLDLVDVLTQRGVKLKRVGSGYKALCPFHEESTPSFSVNPAAQLWHCFGCGKGGDVFTFVMEQEHISFTEAVKKLCKRDIQAKDLEQLNREREQEQPVVTIDRPAQEIFGRIFALWQEALARSAKAMAYLKGRGLWVRELLLALSIGYASGKLPQTLPKDGKLRRQLTRMGLLNKKGNEFLFNRVVCPIFDENGVLVNVYGRSIDPESEVPHLYLPGPRRGVFNHVGIRDASTVILTESILDGLSLVVLGFTNATASYGASGFTADHLAAFKRSKTTRVYCAYDADPAGDHAADQLAHDLVIHGIEVLRVVLPCKDPNDFLKAGGTKEEFQALLDQARPLLPQPPLALTGIAPTEAPAALPEPTPMPVPASTAPRSPRDAMTVRLGERAYEVVAIPSMDSLALRVRLRVQHQGRAFIDTLNLYADRARLVAVARLAKLFGPAVTKEQVEADLFAVIDAVETSSRAPATNSPPENDMSPEDQTQAVALLTDPDLAGKIQNHITAMGVVGEDLSKLLVYIVATSRKTDEPLALVVVSRSSAGKSYEVQQVCELMPTEDHLPYTRVSAKAFFHDEPDRLRHKLISIEEAGGMEEASYALRVMLSNQMLRNLTTITDPVDGRHKAQENVVYGPVALIVTTTQELDYETLSRAFVISIDESVEQTERIHEMQRRGKTRTGLSREIKRKEIIKTHQNAQRLLKALRVVNDFAPYLTFPKGTVRLRREHKKYLALIDAVTFLFQFQRKQGVHEEDGQSVEYVEADYPDIDLANRLMVASLRQARDEMNATTRDLLTFIRTMLTKKAAGEDLTELRFTRRELREYTEWSDHPMRECLEKLEKLEYVHAISGSVGKEYVYTLSPDHRLALGTDRSIDEEIRELGLISAEELRKLLIKKPKP
jgi:DNA primase catalytic core